MKYLYTSEDCPKCTIRKRELKASNTLFTERSADRLNGGIQADAVDVEAHIQLNMNNMQLPVEVDFD